MTYSDIIPAMLWKPIDNNNRATARRIGKQKNVIKDRVSDDNKNPALIYGYILTCVMCNKGF